MADPSAIESYIFQQREDARKEFDERYRAQLDDAVADIGRLYSFLTIAVIEGVDLGLGPRFDGFALLKTALEFLVSSLHLCRDGARLDSFALLRVAIEAGCTAVHIVEDVEAHEQYAGRRGRRYDSGRAISYAKKHIHRVEELWSALSQAAIHPSRNFFGPQRQADGSQSIKFGPILPNARECALLMLTLSIATMIVNRACEVVLLIDDGQAAGWLRLIGTKFIVTANANASLKEQFGRLDAATSAC
jgi:hypothetical protein